MSRFKNLAQAEAEVERLVSELKAAGELCDALRQAMNPWVDKTWPVKIKLDEPIKVGDHGWSGDEIIVRRPVLGDLRDVELRPGLSVDFNAIRKVGARLLSNVPEDERQRVYDRLPPEAAIACQVATNFIVHCL